LESVGVLHRDLKPENLILNSKNMELINCTVKLADFGLATFASCENYLFKRCGTPGFVAPEIISADAKADVKFTPKCDVFGCGVIFYIL
jgi:serine/threonine protein kinase